MKMLVHPRDANPYQRELYSALGRRGHRVRYIGDCSPSQTSNLILLPAELLVGRLQGYRVLHIHWLFRFNLPLAARLPQLRYLCRLWLVFVLKFARKLGIRVVWIAHNAVPHERIFDDDIAARKALIDASDAVVAHSSAALHEVATISALPAQAAVVRHPGYAVGSPGSHAPGGATLRVLFFGNVLAYKGADELARAAARAARPVHVTIAGECRDGLLRAELERLAAAAPDRIALHLERIHDTAIEDTVRRSDLVALPFRRVTTSGSAAFALSCGRPILIPDVPAFRELPDEIVVRYPPSGDVATSLATAMDRACELDLAGMGRAAAHWAQRYTWSDLAVQIESISFDQTEAAEAAR